MHYIKQLICFGLIFLIILSTSCQGESIDQPEVTTTLETTKEQTTTDAKPQTTNAETTKAQTTVKPVEEINKPFSATFFTDDVLYNIQKNCEEFPEFKEKQKEVVNQAKKYMELSRDELWNFVFPPELERSWMVLSDGICPSCKDPVVMYDWLIDPVEHPWKLQCPHCDELFPKNDFYAYYQSGLDDSGRFSYDKADETLLVNEETGKGQFGVDDGKGFVEGNRNFRFIATYLVYGQWKGVILDAIQSLSEAYIYTQETEYGVRALILLDRLADFWPEYDYNKQGWLYERIGTCAGYISYRIDAAFEVYDLAISYDKVKEVLFKDPDVCEFLSEKAVQTGVNNKKKTPEDVKKNIDDRLLRDSSLNTAKIQSNAPYTDLAVVICQAVLDWQNNQGMLTSRIWNIVTNNTRFDGMTGESGLAGYATMGKSAIAQLCNLFVYADPDFVKTMYSRSKSLYDAYRFHIDLHCVDKYYPLLGDTSYFGHDADRYPNFQEGAENLMLYELYEATGDEDLLKAIYQSNDDRTDGAFLLFPGLPDIAKRYDKINQAVKDGRAFVLDSVRKDKYQIAVLRTGTGKDKTEVWINFGTNKISHNHGDGMNIGVYYKDADLMPDNGYPNVAYGGGWSSPQVAWTLGTLSHNVISFNNQGHSRTNGRISLWAIGDAFKVFRANAAGTFANVKKYERSLALVDITDQNAYVVDVFRVGNGPSGTYEKYSRSNIGQMSVRGIQFSDVDKPYPTGTFLENFKQSVRLETVWEAEWAIEDYFDVMEYGDDMHLRMIDLTKGEKVFTCDTWLPPAYQMSSSGHEGFKLPTVITSKTVTQGETTAFVSILEPYSKESQILQARRLSCSVDQDYIERDTNVALEIKTVNGATDVVILLDPDVTEGKKVEVSTDRGMIQTDAQSCLIRYDKLDQPIMIRASKGSFVKIGDQEYEVKNADQPTEINLK